MNWGGAYSKKVWTQTCGIMSSVTSLEDEDTTYGNIDFNGYKLYVNGKAIN